MITLQVSLHHQMPSALFQLDFQGDTLPLKWNKALAANSSAYSNQSPGPFRKMKPQPTTTKELDDSLSEPTERVLNVLGEPRGTFAVLGAGGKMGFHLSRMIQRGLAATGYKEPIITVSRFGSKKTLAQFESTGFQVHRADMSDAQQVAQLPDADNVFFLAGIKFGTSGNTTLLKQMNEQMPRIVAERYRNSRIVALSTGCVYEFVTPDSGGSTEQSATNPPGDYAKSCLGREQAFVTNSLEHGTPTSLIRLNYSNECRYGVLVDIASKVLAGDSVSLDTGYVNVIWQRDAVVHVIQSLEHASTPPFVINVTGPETLAVRELAELFGQRFHRKPKFIGQPTETAWLNNPQLSHQLFGPPETSLIQMIDSIANWLIKGGQTLGKPTQFEKRDGDY